VPPVETLHSWDLNTKQARDLQLELAARVDVTRPVTSFETVAGADISYELRGKWLYAAVVVLQAGTWEIIERSEIVTEAKFPYKKSIKASGPSSSRQPSKTVPTLTRHC
jgi:deoxyribonuclease V